MSPYNTHAIFCTDPFMENERKYISNSDKHDPNKDLLFKCKFLHTCLPPFLSTICLIWHRCTHFKQNLLKISVQIISSFFTHFKCHVKPANFKTDIVSII